MNEPSTMPTTSPTSAPRERAKRITLVVLLCWVAMVFVVTMLKFAKVW